MLRSFKDILGSVLDAQDGQIGHSDDFLFDDVQCTVRYLVVKTGGLLGRKRVLISPLGVAHADWEKRSLRLRLTRQQIEESPDVDTDQPVFRKMETLTLDHYGWPYYWTDTSIWGVDPQSPLMIGDQPRLKSSEKDFHLWSCRKVTGYAVEAEDSGVGHVEDFLIEEGTWTIRYLVVDTKTWRPHRPVLISPQWVQSIDWSSRSIRIDLKKKEIQESPEFEKNTLVDRLYEDRLYQHYRRPSYWNESSPSALKREAS
jgi:hypothetical protein